MAEKTREAMTAEQDRGRKKYLLTEILKKKKIFMENSYSFPGHEFLVGTISKPSKQFNSLTQWCSDFLPH